MLDQLLNLVKEHAGDAIINNPAIPNEQNDAAISAAAGSIFDGLKGALSGGNVNDLAALFQGGANSSGITQAIQGGFLQNLTEKFGIDGAQASSIAGSLIPQVMQQLASKTADPNDNSFDVAGILSSLTGKDAGGLGDLISQFTGGAGGGGLMDSLKGLFGK